MALLRSLRSLALVLAVPTLLHGQNATAPELPHVGTAFVLEDGKLVQIHASEAKFNNHAVGNYLRAQVFVGPDATLTVDGATSALQVMESSPVFYVRLGEDPEITRKRVELLHLGVDAKSRSVVTLSHNVFGGHHKRYETLVPMLLADTGDPTVVEVKVSQALEPGEYAFAFMPSDPDQTPTVVYDFTIAGAPKASEPAKR